MPQVPHTQSLITPSTSRLLRSLPSGCLRSLPARRLSPSPLGVSGPSPLGVSGPSPLGLGGDPVAPPRSRESDGLQKSVLEALVNYLPPPRYLRVGAAPAAGCSVDAEFTVTDVGSPVPGERYGSALPGAETPPETPPPGIHRWDRRDTRVSTQTRAVVVVKCSSNGTEVFFF